MMRIYQQQCWLPCLRSWFRGIYHSTCSYLTQCELDANWKHRPWDSTGWCPSNWGKHVTTKRPGESEEYANGWLQHWLSWRQVTRLIRDCLFSAYPTMINLWWQHGSHDWPRRVSDGLSSHGLGVIKHCHLKLQDLNGQSSMVDIP